MVRTIAVIWTGVAAGLTAIGAIYMMTMAAGSMAMNVLLLISAMLCGAVCVGLATDGRSGRPRALSPYMYHESIMPVRRTHPNITRSSPTNNRLQHNTDTDRKVRSHPRSRQVNEVSRFT